MDLEQWSLSSRERLRPGSNLVARHLEYLRQFVAIDSRSFNVNEFEGDRTTPSDMQEILELARRYLLDIGFQTAVINTPPPSPGRSTPILMAEWTVSPDRPTVLMYAHLDKQPYMDDHRFLQWQGRPPTELHWNEDGSRAYGRGAADDLSGVVAIGMAVDALTNRAGDPQEPPCNLKVIFETEEESGSHTLIDQILQNREFFSGIDAVIITDVTNPDTGVPGLTTSLRGIIQVAVEARAQADGAPIDAQTALYKLLATLVDDTQALTVRAIAAADVPVTAEEREGYRNVPTTVAAMREQAGLLPEVRTTVPGEKVPMIEAQLRISYVNARPGHRVAGSVLLGTAGVRLHLPLPEGADRARLLPTLEAGIQALNLWRLKMTLSESGVPRPDRLSLDLVLQSSEKDPHSGIHGGPFPVPELQLARIIDHIVSDTGRLTVPGLDAALPAGADITGVTLESLRTGPGQAPAPYGQPDARAVVEIRLAPGNDEREALNHLKNHLLEHVLPDFDLTLEEDKAGGAWMTSIEHPAFALMMEALTTGYGREACLYGCGGSIPFVAKLMSALGDVPPLVIGAYDPACKMHEPGESLSLADLLGCARSVVHFCALSQKAFK